MTNDSDNLSYLIAPVEPIAVHFVQWSEQDSHSGTLQIVQTFSNAIEKQPPSRSRVRRRLDQVAEVQAHAIFVAATVCRDRIRQVHVDRDQTTVVPMILQCWIARIVDDGLRRRSVIPATRIVAANDRRHLSGRRSDLVNNLRAECVRTVASELTRQNFA